MVEYLSISQPFNNPSQPLASSNNVLMSGFGCRKQAIKQEKKQCIKQANKQEPNFKNFFNLKKIVSVC